MGLRNFAGTSIVYMYEWRGIHVLKSGYGF